MTRGGGRGGGACEGVTLWTCDALESAVEERSGPSAGDGGLPPTLSAPFSSAAAKVTGGWEVEVALEDVFSAARGLNEPFARPGLDRISVGGRWL